MTLVTLDDSLTQLLETPGYWLRWWDETGQLLLWGVERLQQEQQLRRRSQP
ncbi:MAG: hypothetical protein V7K23_17560 [Nostoc sp.]